LLGAEKVKNAVIFCNRKRDISTLVTSLTRHGFSAVALHGDMTQSARLEALQKFKDGDVPLLIASDVAARGLDIAGLSHVFNFDVPMSAEDYVHRIGRTGRAGKSGRAFTIAAGKDDIKYISSIETLIDKPIPPITLYDAKIADATTPAVPADASAVAYKPKLKPKGKSAQTVKKAPASTQKNRNRGDELPSPPDCQGSTMEETGHIPAFLTR
jgi:superfamily II DNA/RNA helicase